MKRKLNPGLSLLAIIGLLMVAGVYEGKEKQVHPEDPMVLSAQAEKAVQGSIIQNVDSIQNSMLMKDGTGTDYFSMGFREMEDSKEKFLRLDNYRLKPGVSLSIRKGKYYLTRQVKNHETTGVGINQMEIPIRYQFDPGNIKAKGAVLIPVSANSYMALKILVYFLYAVTVAFMLYVFLFLPIRMFFSISKGEFFNKVNHKNLGIIGWSLVIFPLFQVSLSLVNHWLYKNDIPDGIYFNFWEILVDEKMTIAAGFIVLLFAQAFEKGYRLKKTKDLTI